MENKVVDEAAQGPYRIRPEDIDLDGGEDRVFEHQVFAGAFGKHEAEELAYWLVRLFQSRGGWYSFTKDELSQLLSMPGPSSGAAMFWGEHPPLEWFAEEGPDGRWRLSEWFIDKCHKVSPAAT